MSWGGVEARLPAQAPRELQALQEQIEEDTPLTVKALNFLVARHRGCARRMGVDRVLYKVRLSFPSRNVSRTSGP